ncbi:MAG: DHH family phosphoesterase [Candidatus Micrarchaeia archaeon]|jgi:nanoRNase/pAp phosphatase (c-di-AMP/oligoRNAs hydrolase)
MIKELKNKKCVITFHTNSDIDAVSSAYALQNVLGKNVKIAHFGRIDYDAKMLIKIYNKEIKNWEEITDFDYLIVLDGQNTSMFPHMENKIADLLIDHHNSANVKIKSKKQIIKPDAISTTEILYELFKKENIHINSETAELLLCGIISDSLRYKEVSKNTFAFSNELRKKIKKTYEQLIEISLPRLPKEECIGFFQSAKTFKYEIVNEMIIAIAIGPSYTGEISTVLSETVADVVFVISPKEHNSILKLSGRTWVGCGVDLTKVLEKLGKKFNGIGGGHPYAAGMDFKITPKEINTKQEEILNECILLSKEEIINKGIIKKK